MSADQELQTWIAEWTAGRETLDGPGAVRDHVRRRTRLLTVWMFVELAIVVSALAFLVQRAATHPDPIERVAMALLATICAFALAFGAWNWQGVWRPAAQTTSEFLELSRDRARRFRRAAHAGWFVLLAQAVVFAPWVWLRSGEQQWPWAFLLAMLGGGAMFLVKCARWATGEAKLLDDLARELEE